MRVLVTGADGFVGRHLVSHLRACGDEVTPTDITDLDVRSEVAVRDAISGCRPDVLYHLAAQSDPAASWQAPVETWHTNTVGTVAVLSAAVQAGYGLRVIVVSSAAVYGDGRDGRPISEDMPPAPTSPYAASKLSAEIAAGQAVRAGVDVVVARPFNNIGPGQRANFLVPAIVQRIARAAATGAGSIAVGSTGSRRDFVDVRDVAHAFRKLAEVGVSGKTYNICSGAAVSIGEIVDRLVALSGIALDVVHDPSLVRSGDPKLLVGDPDRVMNATGWQPRLPIDVSLRDALREALA